MHFGNIYPAAWLKKIQWKRLSSNLRGFPARLLNYSRHLDSDSGSRNTRLSHMAKVSFIVARTDENVIGCENKLPWKLRTDLKQFRKLTTGKIIIMGRKTFDSIGHPLPDRENYIISRRRDLNYDNVRVFDDINTAVLVAETIANSKGLDEIFVIGGEQIFSAMASHVAKVYLTQIHTTGIRGDAFFRMDFLPDQWKLSEKKEVKQSADDEYNFTFYVYERKKSAKKLRYPKGFSVTDPVDVERRAASPA